MRKLRPISLAVIGVILWSHAVVARPSVGLLLKVRGPEGFWAEFEKGAQAAADAVGVDLIIKGTSNVANAGAQIKLLDSFVSSKVDVLIVTPASPEQLVAPLTAQAEKGLKILIGESELATATPFPFVGYDQGKLALAAANAIAEQLNDRDEIALFRGASDQVILQRDKVILARWKETLPNLRVHSDFHAISTETSTVEDKAELLLKTHPGAKLYIGTSSPSTTALLNAARKQADRPVKIAGFGFRLTPPVIQAIEDGTMQAYVCQLPREIGYQCVATAASMARGEKVPSRTDINFLVITKTNVNLPAVQAMRTP